MDFATCHLPALWPGTFLTSLPSLPTYTHDNRMHASNPLLMLFPSSQSVNGPGQWRTLTMPVLVVVLTIGTSCLTCQVVMIVVTYPHTHVTLYNGKGEEEGRIIPIN